MGCRASEAAGCGMVKGVEVGSLGGLEGDNDLVYPTSIKEVILLVFLEDMLSKICPTEHAKTGNVILHTKHTLKFSILFLSF